MKKKIITVLAVIIMAFPALAFGGCGKDAAEKNKTTVLLYDFEGYSPSLQLITLGGFFGKVTFNDDPQYVKSGAGSAKLQPLGSYGGQGKPQLNFPLKSELFDFDYSNLMQLKRISAQVFNAEDADVNIYTGITAGGGATPTQDAALKPGWNTVHFVPDINFLSLSFNMSKCVEIFFRFDNAQSRDIAHAPVLYMDDIVLQFNETDVEYEDLVVLDEYEICDFEKHYQRYLAYGDGGAKYTELMPQLQVVKATDYGLAAPSEVNVLRILAKASQAVDHSAPAWPGFLLPERLMKAAALSRFTQHTDYKISFSIYVNSPGGMDVSPHFYNDNGFWGNVMESVPGLAWKTVTYTIDRILASKTDGGIGAPADFLTRTGLFRMTWMEFTGTDTEIFFDNFRIIPV